MLPRNGADNDFRLENLIEVRLDERKLDTPDFDKGVGPARRPSIRRIGASGLRDKPMWRSLRLKRAAIWGMSTNLSQSIPS